MPWKIFSCSIHQDEEKKKVNHLAGKGNALRVFLQIARKTTARPQ
jgi:hypothetical protein